MWAWVRRIAEWWEQRASAARQISAGSGASVVLPEYSAEEALSTLARFPWVWVCASAVAYDLAGQPLVAVQSQPDGSRRLVDDAALALLQAPSPGVPGTLFRAQVALDRYITGNGYVWVPGLAAWRLGVGQYPALALRLHPAHLEAITGRMGLVLRWRYTDTTTGAPETIEIDPGDVIHLRGPSWRDTALSVLGESVIRCLHDDLVTELKSRELAAKQAAKGRPDVILAAAGPLDDAAKKRMIESYDRSLKEAHGAYVVGNGVTATPVSWTPEQFPLGDRTDKLRDTILALFEVTPARAGLVTANYGTDRQQARTYWSSLQRKSTEWSDGWSLLCRPGTRIETDFAAVEALQVSYSERMARVQGWVALGATPAAAAAYEGFDEAPVGDSAPGSTASTAPRTDSQDGYQGDRRSLDAVVAEYLVGAAARYTAAEGADLTLLHRAETQVLRSVLERAGVAEADWWAETVTEITAEAVRSASGDLTELGAFSRERAARLAARMQRREAA